LALDYKRRFLGKTIDVLVEEERSDGMLSGYSERYIKALFPGPRELTSEIVPVEVTEIFPGYVRAHRRGEEALRR
ncbi:MAG: TRAM domain-containing protein, partial [Candidatus Brocadiales bacterium]|nr:TRAM domain-containing protein [Candidatus Bathyanammoxibius sp.]